MNAAWNILPLNFSRRLSLKTQIDHPIITYHYQSAPGTSGSNSSLWTTRQTANGFCQCFTALAAHLAEEFAEPRFPQLLSFLLIIDNRKKKIVVMVRRWMTGPSPINGMVLYKGIDW